LSLVNSCSTITSLHAAASHNDKLPEDALAYTQRLLTASLQEIAWLQSNIRFYKIAMAPHRKLPDGILRKIFLHCVSPRIKLPPQDYYREAPWNIIRLCSKWRRIAFGTSVLWTDIWVRYAQDDRYTFRLTTNLARSAIARCGDAPI
jgi:hypothetical protein